MTRIVTTTYRYKLPPRKRKAVAIEAPAVVTAKKPPPGVGGGQGFGTARHHNGAARSIKRGAPVISLPHHSAAPDLAPEELRRRGAGRGRRRRVARTGAAGDRQGP